MAVRRPRKKAESDSQRMYTRGCMLLFFHKHLYEHEAAPCITDAQYDKLERYVEALEAQSDVKAHAHAPTHKTICPSLFQMPFIVRDWVTQYQRTNKPPTLPEGLTGVRRVKRVKCLDEKKTGDSKKQSPSKKPVRRKSLRRPRKN